MNIKYKIDKLPEDIVIKILKNIKIEFKIKYVAYGDGEQTYSLFYKDDKKYKCCKLFYNYFNNDNRKNFKNFFENF